MCMLNCLEPFPERAEVYRGKLLQCSGGDRKGPGEGCGSRDADKGYRRHLEVEATLAHSWGLDETQKPPGESPGSGS